MWGWAGLELEWTVGDVWLATVELPASELVDTKIVICNDVNGETTWSPFPNVGLGRDVQVHIQTFCLATLNIGTSPTHFSSRTPHHIVFNCITLCLI